MSSQTSCLKYNIDYMAHMPIPVRAEPTTVYVCKFPTMLRNTYKWFLITSGNLGLGVISGLSETR